MILLFNKIVNGLTQSEFGAITSYSEVPSPNPLSDPSISTRNLLPPPDPKQNNRSGCFLFLILECPPRISHFILIFCEIIPRVDLNKAFPPATGQSLDFSSAMRRINCLMDVSG
ncbi:unnamed protein product [Lactuca virosa]|uniref:Uncharacterized protein n=1 Tax=Lactuca virosa TaxID=75947 RepID=A0AAU9M062_9ASTR|nr:unnamed protein product [Lactuca virosa]